MSDLTGVKVGDKVFVSRGGYDRGHITTVKKITPSGRVITVNGSVYNQDGYRRGETSAWHRTFARVATEDDIAGIYRYSLVEKFKSFDWNKCSAEDLKTINEIVNRSVK